MSRLQFTILLVLPGIFISFIFLLINFIIYNTTPAKADINYNYNEFSPRAYKPILCDQKIDSFYASLQEVLFKIYYHCWLLSKILERIYSISKINKHMFSINILLNRHENITEYQINHIKMFKYPPLPFTWRCRFVTTHFEKLRNLKKIFKVR